MQGGVLVLVNQEHVGFSVVQEEFCGSAFRSVKRRFDPSKRFDPRKEGSIHQEKFRSIKKGSIHQKRFDSSNRVPSINNECVDKLADGHKNKIPGRREKDEYAQVRRHEVWHCVDVLVSRLLRQETRHLLSHDSVAVVMLSLMSSSSFSSPLSLSLSFSLPSSSSSSSQSVPSSSLSLSLAMRSFSSASSLRSL